MTLQQSHAPVGQQLLPFALPVSVAAGVGWSSPDSPPPASRTGQTAVQISHTQSAIQLNKCPLHFARLRLRVPRASQ